jgi:hypothetical protein
MTNPNIPEKTAMPIADSGNQGGIRMWPSEDLASKLYDLANWGLIAGLMIGVISTVLIVWMGNVKETYLRKGLGDTNLELEKQKERAAKAEGNAADAKKESAEATNNVAILQEAAANAKAAQQKVEIDLAKQQEHTAVAERALLELKQKMADRHIMPQQRDKMLFLLRTGPPRHLVVQSLLSAGREALQYASEIADVFRAAGWDVTPPTGIGSFSAPVSGVILVAGPNSEELTGILVSVLIAGEVCKIPVDVSPSKNTSIGTTEIWVLSKPPN